MDARLWCKVGHFYLEVYRDRLDVKVTLKWLNKELQFLHLWMAIF